MSSYHTVFYLKNDSLLPIWHFLVISKPCFLELSISLGTWNSGVQLPLHVFQSVDNFQEHYFAGNANIIIVNSLYREGHSLSPCRILLTGPPGAGKRTVAIATSKRLLMHIFEVSCYDLIGESVAATEARLKNTFQRGLLAFCGTVSK